MNHNGHSTQNDLGKRGEDFAVEYLVERGWRIVERNWRCSIGEIDIVAIDPNQTLVFCEVKCRSGYGYGAPLEAITYAKRRKLRQLVQKWFAESEHIFSDQIRIDGIGIVMRRGFRPELVHIAGVGDD